MVENCKGERAKEKADQVITATFVSVFKMCAITQGYTEMIKHELDIANTNSFTNLLFRARGKCKHLLKHLQTSRAGIGCENKL